MSVSSRTTAALRRRANWVQLAKFGAVGVSGYVINLVVYTALLGWGPHVAAAISFVVAAASNYWWNRHWTFARQKGNFGYQGDALLRRVAARLRSEPALAVRLHRLLDWRKVVSQAIAIILVTPLNFLGNKLWSFRS